MFDGGTHVFLSSPPPSLHSVFPPSPPSEEAVTFSILAFLRLAWETPLMIAPDSSHQLTKRTASLPLVCPLPDRHTGRKCSAVGVLVVGDEDRIRSKIKVFYERNANRNKDQWYLRGPYTLQRVNNVIHICQCSEVVFLLTGVVTGV